VLAAVKEDKRDYKPDPKSRTAWQLATHLATADLWFIECITNGKFAFDPEAVKQQEARFANVSDIVEFYKKNFPDKLHMLAAMPAAAMAENIDFFNRMNRSRAAWIGFANNHSIHHRGQLASYLRAMGSKVPNIYGPSADAED
jgi:uncharacterized damage-inducible protein DinB